MPLVFDLTQVILQILPNFANKKTAVRFYERRWPKKVKSEGGLPDTIE